MAQLFTTTIFEVYNLRRIYSNWLNRPRASLAHNHVCEFWRCSDTARATYVDAPGGKQKRLCRRHWLATQDTERVDRVRRELAMLFRHLWPLGLSPGATAWAALWFSFVHLREFIPFIAGLV